MTGEFNVIDVHDTPPASDVTKGIGRNHELTTALADLVDNSLDAKATKVLIRFLTTSNRVEQLQIVDNGVGMDAAKIAAAMRYGGQSHGTDHLGHFGIGLKAASLSQAMQLTVLSRVDSGPPVGRRIHDDLTSRVEELDPNDVERVLDRDWKTLDTKRSGTVVQWDYLRTTFSNSNAKKRRIWINETISRIRAHLGLIFHRFLQPDSTGARSLTIWVEEHDLDTAESGFSLAVDPIDPVGYPRSGATGYPKVLEAHVHGHTIMLNCHVWPARSESPLFRHGCSVEEAQGLYFYRNNRLINWGGWADLERPSRLLRLGRVIVDVEQHARCFPIVVEKNAVHPDPDTKEAIQTAIASDGTTFVAYLSELERTQRASSQTGRKRKPILAGGEGLPPRVRDEIEDAWTLLDDDPVNIIWRKLPTTEFVDVDRTSRTLWLNERYKTSMQFTDGDGHNPLVNTLLYLLYESTFRADLMSPTIEDQLILWKAALTQAAREGRDRDAE